ncbi:MAG: helix-turn-helix domain-containing protein [Ruminococcus sp.]|nr:helix-turn-helix domain-containing protein [Ruminococcus sp.]
MPLRKESGLTQQEVASQLGVTKGTVGNYEQGIRCPSNDALVKLADIFHVTVNYLLGLEDRQHKLDVSDLEEDDIAFLKCPDELLRKKNN